MRPRWTSPRHDAESTSLPRGASRFRNLPSSSEVSLTDLCESPELQGLGKYIGRAFALDRTDELSAAGRGELRGVMLAELVNRFRHSATVSHLQIRFV